MEIVCRKREYLVHDLLVECDCSCSFARFSEFEDNPNKIDITYYGPYSIEGSQLAEESEEILSREQLKLLAFTLQNQTQSDMRINNLRLLNEDNGNIISLIKESKEKKTVWEICLQKEEATRLGKVLTTWVEES